MYAQEALGLLRRFKATHTSLSGPSRLMRNPGSVIRIPGCIVNRVWNECSMCDVIAYQLIGRYFPRFIMVILQQALEKSLDSVVVASCPQKHIDYLSVLSNSSPQVLLLTLDSHEHCVDENCIAKSLMSALKALAIFGSKLVTPQAIRLTVLPQYHVLLTNLRYLDD